MSLFALSALLLNLVLSPLSRASLPDDDDANQVARTALEAPELPADFDVTEALDLAEDDAKAAEEEARRDSVEVAGFFDFLTGGGSSPAPALPAPPARGGRRHSHRSRHRHEESEPGESAAPETSSSCRELRGMASWYGPGFSGHRTASGQRLNGGAFTAAHRTLPFGTVVRVTNMQNGRSVHVTINDRGPFGGGRIIDLTVAARTAIGMVGTALVSLQTCL